MVTTAKGQNLLAWLICCALTGLIFVVYLSVNLVVGQGEPVMPLDDVYIHFQYARQLASGQINVYNPGDPPTSGATSFLYPFILAAGYLLGFRDLWLGVWAMIVGAAALLTAAWSLYRLLRIYGVPYALGLLLLCAFLLNGALMWHFMSGMETGLMVALTLLTLFAFSSNQARSLGVTATLLTLMRPEGGLLALIAVGAWLITHKNAPHRGWLLLPLIGLCVQPLTNLLLTGSIVAAGNQAKSILGMIPFYWDTVLLRIVENIARMTAEFALSTSPREGQYFPHLFIFVVAGLVYLLRQHRGVATLLVLWLLAGVGSISTLDTAFWHFKRYQIPLMTLFFPLAGWGVAYILQIPESRWKKLFVPLCLCAFVLSLLQSFFTLPAFLRFYALNTSYVYAQPLQMARWLAANTAADSTIAVHDVGMMRYMGGRRTLDMVGLTTPGAADAWRSGPGAVAEFLIDQQPDYIAAYTEARGLGYLAATDLYGDALATFPVEVDLNANVALAAEQAQVVQGIYRPDWSVIQTQLPRSGILSPDAEPLAIINVADLRSEATVRYQWSNTSRIARFPTEVYQLDDLTCWTVNCTALDGGRVLDGIEAFELSFESSVEPSTLLLISRVHPVHAGTFDVYANDQWIGTCWIPAAPGYWLEIPTIVPYANPLIIRIQPHVSEGGFYSPYRHRVYPAPTPRFLTTPPLAAYQSGAILLMQHELIVQDSLLTINLTWQTPDGAQGDYKVFAHVYADPSQPPVAQTDAYPRGDYLPGNWLPGAFDDTLQIDISQLASGQYTVAIGLYDTVTLQNLPPDSGGDALGRFFIGDIEIPDR